MKIDSNQHFCNCNIDFICPKPCGVVAAYENKVASTAVLPQMYACLLVR